MTNLLSKNALRSGTADGAAIVLARVKDVRIDSAGSRSEAAVFKLAVEQVLCGSSPSSLTVWRYTSGKSTLHGLGKTLQRGNTCVLAFERGDGPWPAPRALVEFVLVPEGRQDEIVEAHLEALRQINVATRR